MNVPDPLATSIPSLLFFLPVALMAIYAWRTIFSKIHHGTIVLDNGHTYNYVLGDNMRSYGAARFNGIEVLLPKDLPHMYFDSLRGGGKHSGFYPDPSQLLHLEGDFSSYFRVFVPRRYETVALSILSPDVMATLADHASDFDIEIYKNKLRIISRERPYKKQAVTDALVTSVTQLIVEIDHKLGSWSDEDAQQTKNQELRVITVRGFRLFGRHITYVSLFFSALFSPVPLIAAYVVWHTWQEHRIADAIEVGIWGGIVPTIIFLWLLVRFNGIMHIRSRQPEDTWF